jgi:hypothetical protein
MYCKDKVSNSKLRNTSSHDILELEPVTILIPFSVVGRMFGIYRVPPKYNAIFHCSMEVCKISHCDGGHVPEMYIDLKPTHTLLTLCRILLIWFFQCICLFNSNPRNLVVVDSFIESFDS